MKCEKALWIQTVPFGVLRNHATFLRYFLKRRATISAKQSAFWAYRSPNTVSVQFDLLKNPEKIVENYFLILFTQFLIFRGFSLKKTVFQILRVHLFSSFCFLFFFSAGLMRVFAIRVEKYIDISALCYFFGKNYLLQGIYINLHFLKNVWLRISLRQL